MEWRISTVRVPESGVVLPGSGAHILPVHEDTDVATDLARLVPKLELEARIAPLRHVDQIVDGVGLDLFVAPRAELPEPAVQVDLVHGSAARP